MTERAGTSSADTSGLARAYRPARALIGWMRPDQAILTLARRDQGATGDPALASHAEAARAAVLARDAGLDQDGLLQNPPTELDAHADALRAHPAGASMFAEGWSLAVADIARICSIQPTVFTDSAEERVRDVDAADIVAVGQVSLPIPQPTQLPAQFDESRQAWLFSSRNPNLRVAGHFGADVQPGVHGFGFVVAVSPSFMQVARFGGRYLLRDGYHRAYGFLRRGISHAPVFYREFATFEDLALPQGMLPQDAYLGQRPARLADYLDDSVAADVELPASQKMIVIQGLEITPLG